MKVNNFRPYHGAGLLLWTKNENGQMCVLLGKRSINPGKGKWSIPGGKWDLEKDLYDKDGRPNYVKTALRETKEEIRLEITEDKDINQLWISRIPWFNYIVYEHYFPVQKSFAHNSEFYKVDWFSVSELPTRCAWFVRSQVATLVCST